MLIQTKKKKDYDTTFVEIINDTKCSYQTQYTTTMFGIVKNKKIKLN